MSGIRIHSAAVTISLAIGFVAGMVFEYGQSADFINQAEFLHVMKDGKWKRSDEIAKAYHVMCSEGE